MPTYQNANLILNITYTTIQPAAGAIYTDTNGTQFTILNVGDTRYYVVSAGTDVPALGTLTKISGTGDTSVKLNSYTNNPMAIFGLNRIEPGDTLATNEYVRTLPPSVVITSVSPFYNPILLSQDITTSTTVSIPASVTGNYRVAIYSGTGTTNVKLNDSSATACLIPEGLAKEFTCFTRTIDNVIIAPASGGEAFITVEAI